MEGRGECPFCCSAAITCSHRPHRWTFREREAKLLSVVKPSSVSFDVLFFVCLFAIVCYFWLGKGDRTSFTHIFYAQAVRKTRLCGIFYFFVNWWFIVLEKVRTQWFSFLLYQIVMKELIIFGIFFRSLAAFSCSRVISTLI